jgi:hypothetical protein
MSGTNLIMNISASGPSDLSVHPSDLRGPKSDSAAKSSWLEATGIIPSAPNDEALSEDLGRLNDERLQRLRRLLNGENLESYPVTSSLFPRAQGLVFGGQHASPSESWDPVSALLNPEADFLLRHGMRLVTSSLSQTSPMSGGVIPYRNQKILTWAKDPMAFGDSGIRIPCVSPNVSDMPRDIYQARMKRDPDLYHTGREFSYAGRVDEDGKHKEALHFSRQAGVPITMDLTSWEGGNRFLGAFEDGTKYVILGKDSFAFSKRALEADLKQALTDDFVKKAIGIDCDVDPSMVFLVEQPSCFHLDMRMALVGPRKVILNDAVKASQTMVDHLNSLIKEAQLDGHLFSKVTRNNPTFLKDLVFGDLDMLAILAETSVAALKTLLETNSAEFDKIYGRSLAALPSLSHEKLIDLLNAKIGKIEANATAAKNFEDQTAKDLVAQGFQVLRIPGCFQDPITGEDTNLFNFVSVTTPRGERVILSTGCDDDMCRKFEDNLRRIGCEFDEIFFADRNWSIRTLRQSGGLACRTSVIGLF